MYATATYTGKLQYYILVLGFRYTFRTKCNPFYFLMYMELDLLLYFLYLLVHRRKKGWHTRLSGISSMGVICTQRSGPIVLLHRRKERAAVYGHSEYRI